MATLLQPIPSRYVPRITNKALIGFGGNTSNTRLANLVGETCG